MGNGLSQSSKKLVRVKTSMNVRILSRKDSSKVASMKDFLWSAKTGKATSSSCCPRIKHFQSQML